MRLYEVVYILDAAVGEDGVEGLLDKFHAVLEGSEVVHTEPWGVRQLAYPIKTQRQGNYVVVHIKASPDDLPEFERILKLDESVLRYLIVVNEGEPPTGASILADRPMTPRDEDDEDDDRDDDDDDDDRDDDDDEDRDDDEEASGAAPPEFSGGRGRFRRSDGPRIELLNYKDVTTLSRFMTEQGKILPRRTTKVTSAFQRRLGSAVKRARFLALIPYVRDHDI